MSDFLFNPLLVKEMRDRFRSRKTMVILAIYLFVMGGIPMGFLLMDPLKAESLGDNRDLFLISAGIHYAMVCFVAPALTAGAISGERERQTLPILLTTQLSTRTIILSKLITSLAFSTLLLVASMPLYSIVMLYGSVSPEQMVQLVLFLAVNMFFLGSLGLFCSTWIKRTSISTVTTYGIAFFFVVGTGLLFFFIGESLQQTYPERYVNSDVWSMYELQMLAGMNPIIVLLDILGESFDQSDDISFAPWLFFSCVYVVLSFVLVIWSAYLLKPIRRKWWSWKKRPVRVQ
ncbi:MULTISPECIES: ABC transporter permease [Brevibacillus]|uniref:ABC transporter permease n=1 Tax=Brevibacillus TaxID=55080 RepID=UPI000D105A3E|nr:MULTISPECIES: ABC transporter permease subunit [Brevibacillus]PSJ66854.1 ABC transporter permease [Brevibacillus brevis]RED35989.1 ABC-type transport system involved in multi-copper enzyme maturation permease subunit [Brevibacillus brevis]TQK75234.1 ABC-type transport system involved in multi-copper enzyme maturation permease subunit [Brevibacillus sp. AG162]VEF88901.1 ABC-type transport system involved in multi-copper enzyme maturation, permease component [Brevibacillus brevis]GEC88475.1 h